MSWAFRASAIELYIRQVVDVNEGITVSIPTQHNRTRKRQKHNRWRKIGEMHHSCCCYSHVLYPQTTSLLVSRRLRPVPPMVMSVPVPRPLLLAEVRTDSTFDDIPVM